MNALARLVPMLLLLPVVAAAPDDGWTVQICDAQGECFTFPNVPHCDDWALAPGSTCIVILAIAAGGPGPGNIHPISPSVTLGAEVYGYDGALVFGRTVELACDGCLPQGSGGNGGGHRGPYVRVLA